MLVLASALPSVAIDYGCFGVVPGAVVVMGALAAPSIERTGSPVRGRIMNIRIRARITNATTKPSNEVALDRSRKTAGAPNNSVVFRYGHVRAPTSIKGDLSIKCTYATYRTAAANLPSQRRQPNKVPMTDSPRQSGSMAASRSASLLHSVFQSVISTQRLLAADSQAIHASGTALSPSSHRYVSGYTLRRSSGLSS